MGWEKLIERVYDAEIEGRKEKGRPRKKWTNYLKQRHIINVIIIIVISFIMIGNSTSQNIHRTMTRLLDSDVWLINGSSSLRKGNVTKTGRHFYTQE